MKPPKCKTCGKEEWRHRCLASAVPLTRVRIEEQDFLFAAAPTLTINGAFSDTVTVNRNTASKGGRGKKLHASAAEKQKAYRDRKKANA